jgi:hypothetical protein
VKKSNIMLSAILISVLLIGCKNEDLSAPKTPKMSDNTYLTNPIVPTTPNSPVGTEPAGPTKEAPATTSKEKSDVNKTDQSASMPLPGQANDHSAAVAKSTKFPATAP